MKITIFGTGYVGLVTGTCFAEMGHEAICLDTDQKKIDLLNSGKSPIYEPGLDELIAANRSAGRLHFSSDLAWGVQESELIFIAVGTPPKEDGSADLRHVLAVAETIGQTMPAYRAIVTKSTVPIGTAAQIAAKLQQVFLSRKVTHEFDLISNPEFLKEGTAIEDCLKPSRVVVGCQNERSKHLMERLYEPFLKNGHPLIFMDIVSAEMTKYAANAMLATKISVMNEMSRLAEKVGANIDAVRQGIGTDPRIGLQFLYAGLGYGGSCFPKDVRALIETARSFGLEMTIFQAVEAVNASQRQSFLKMLLQNLKPGARKIACWGLAFKPGTDDIREAPALFLIDALLREKFEVVAYDPVAMELTAKHFEAHPQRQSLSFVEHEFDALKDVDALCIATEWKSFREFNFEKMKKAMKTPLIFDGRNIYTPARMEALGFEYFSIGR